MSFFKTFMASLFAWIVGIVLIVVVSVGILVGSIASLMSGSTTEVNSESILRIDLNENIVDSPMASLMGSFNPMAASIESSITMVNVFSALEKAADDPNIKGICINAEGDGSIDISNIEELREAIEKFKASGKFVVAYNNAYSQAGYYLASVADQVILNPEGDLEWHGLSLSTTFFKPLLDKLGVKYEVFRPASCKFKSAVEPYILDKMSEANRQQSLALANSVWDSICDDVAASRGLSVEALKDYAYNLAVSSPKRALELGLVDAVAHEDYLNTLYDNYGVDRNDFKLHNYISLGEYIASNNLGLPSASIGQHGATEFISSPLIAIIYADGQIVDGNKYEDGSVYGTRLAAELRQARLDDNTKAVVMRVNSPGGSALASEVAWREMILLQETKPVVVSMGGMAASGGYYISAPADYIFADRTTLTGSIGVFAMFPSLGGFLSERVGVNFDSAGTSPSAGSISPFKNLTPEQRTQFNNSVEAIYGTFTSHVAEGRNLAIEDVLKVAEGRVWSGSMAKELGLVDEIGGLNAAVAKARELADIDEQHQLYEFVAEVSPFEQWIMSTGMVLAKQWGLNYNIYGDEINALVRDIPDLFTATGTQMLLPGDVHIEL